METVNDFFRHRKEPIIFLTKEIEDKALELADRIKDKQVSGRQAAVLLKKEFPDLSDSFCKARITDALAGMKWYK
jgi:hypothetical protein